MMKRSKRIDDFKSALENLTSDDENKSDENSQAINEDFQSNGLK